MLHQSGCSRFLKKMLEHSLLPAHGLGRVVGRHAAGHRRQELLPLLLDQAGGADDLVARRPQVGAVHLLRQVFHHHLQVRLAAGKTRKGAKLTTCELGCGTLQKKTQHTRDAGKWESGAVNCVKGVC